MQHIEQGGDLLWLGAFNFLTKQGLAYVILCSLLPPPQCTSAKITPPPFRLRSIFTYLGHLEECDVLGGGGCSSIILQACNVEAV